MTTVLPLIPFYRQFSLTNWRPIPNFDPWWSDRRRTRRMWYERQNTRNGTFSRWTYSSSCIGPPIFTLSRYAFSIIYPKVSFIYFSMYITVHYVANALTAYYALMPVFFIFTVTAIKDGYEHYCKEKSDGEINRQITELVTVSQDKDIRRGDWGISHFMYVFKSSARRK